MIEPTRSLALSTSIRPYIHWGQKLHEDAQRKMRRGFPAASCPVANVKVKWGGN